VDAQRTSALSALVVTAVAVVYAAADAITGWNPSGISTTSV